MSLNFTNSIEIASAKDWGQAIPLQSAKSAIARFSNTRMAVNLFNKNNRTRVYGYFASTGTTWTYASSAYSNKIPCKPNTTYTARYNGNSTQAVLGFGSCSTDEEPSADTLTVTVTRGVRQTSPTINTPVTITTGPNDKWLIVAYNVAEPQNTDMANNLQIVEGSTAKPYYPYFAPTTVLPHLKVHGKTELHILPKLWGQFIPCDGITNAASTSIDTGIKADDNMEIYVRVQAKTDSFYILQARQSSSATIYGLSGSQTGNTITSFGLTSGISRTAGHIYIIKLTMVNRAITLYVKDETTGTEDTKTGTASATYTFPSPTTLKLFGDASKVTSGTTVYHAYIKVNGVMAWDMYPCVDVNNSNAPVAYDDVTHAASTINSGSITAGSLIQPISYAESNGTAWADTGIYGSEKTKITIDFQKTANTQTNMQIVGSNTNTSNAITCNMGSGGNNVSRFGSENKTVALFQDLNRHTLTVANDGYIADGTNVWTPNAAAFTTPDTLLLLSTQNSTSRFVGKVYSANLTEDGTLVRDYIPVRIGTTVELLDLVNWQFATRTGTFTAGADIPYEQLCPVELNGVGDKTANLVDFNETRITSSTWATADKTKGFEIVADVYGKSVGNSLGTNGNCFGVFVPCKKGGSVSIDFFNYAPYYGRCFYCEVDADLKVLTTPVQYSNGTSSLTQKTFTATSDNCIGFAIEWYISATQTRNYTKENYMVVSGTTVPTKYVHYGYAVDVLVGSNNLFGGVYNVKYTLAVPIKAGTAITFSGDNDSSQCYVYLYKANDTEITNNRLASTQSSRRFTTITPTEDVYAVRFSNASLNNLCIRTDGSVEYEPHIPPEEHTVILNHQLNGVVDDEDTFDMQTGVDTGAIGEKALDGTEIGWNISSGTGWVRFYRTFDDAEPGAVVMSTHFEYHSSNNRPGVIRFGASSKQCYLYPSLDIDTIDKWKAWLASQHAKGTPVKIRYPLATPTTTTVPVTPIALTAKGGHTVENTNTLKGQISGEYLGKGE